MVGFSYKMQDLEDKSIPLPQITENKWFTKGKSDNKRLEQLLFTSADIIWLGLWVKIYFYYHFKGLERCGWGV
jgi:hypothetical protein